MKLLRISVILFVSLSLTSCFEDRDDNAVAASDINDFVWKGMNAFYLYKENVDDLRNDRFESNEAYANYLNSFSSPENLFESLVYERTTVDRFSVIIPNYLDFQQGQAGVSKSNGLEFNFEPKPGSDTEFYGIIRLVLNNSPASNLGLERGMIFDRINGNPITSSSANLFDQDTYTLGFATYNDNGTATEDDDTIESTTNSVEITKQIYTENPVHLVDVIAIGGENVGYLVYNGFNSNFNNELNAAFAQLQASNIQHLVLDLRYNPGGSVLTASYLGSMITGQFNGDVYSKLIYNNDLQEFNTSFPFVDNIDGNAINSLNLNRVYVLTTERSASASELVINSLSAYMEDVVQIGDYTTGKTQASITIYDSPDFSPENINPNHTYAMQPLVANSVNAFDDPVPSNGLAPDIEVIEFPGNYGTLGDINEPLLAAALADIQGLGRYEHTRTESRNISKRINLNAHEEYMYIDSNLLYDGVQGNE